MSDDWMVTVKAQVRLEFAQPKLTRVVMSEQEVDAIAEGVSAELRRQIADRLLQCEIVEIVPVKDA